ncbi:MAG: CrcB family protein [Pseudomonadota bacterium]|nr:CrcB family protein [Pseudomonadota bacterium]
MSLGMFAAVAAGGALGAMTRYAVSLGLGAGMFGVPDPLATLAVNVVGSAMMGILAGLVAAGIAIPRYGAVSWLSASWARSRPFPVSRLIPAL